MKLKITINRYDYFDYNGTIKPESIIVDGALNAWKVYKDNQAKDYNYNDAYRTTEYMVIHDDSIPVQQYHHGYMFGHKPTTREVLVRNMKTAYDNIEQYRNTHLIKFDDPEYRALCKAFDEACSKIEAYDNPPEPVRSLADPDWDTYDDTLPF